MKRNERYQPSCEDMIEMGGFEILHPGGTALTQRTGEVTQLKPGMKVLDVSSGRGTQSIYYAHQFGVEVVGVDLSEEMLESAHKNARKAGVEEHVSFVHGDSQKLPLEKNSFDVVINECAVGIPADSQKVLDEMVRVAKPGGMIAIHESTWLKELSSEYREEFADRYGTTPLYLQEWVSMLNSAGVKTLQYELDRWSQPHQFWNTRKDRTPRNHKELATYTEKIHLIKLVYKKYGITGIRNGLQNEKMFWNGILKRNLGYALFWGSV